MWEDGKTFYRDWFDAVDDNYLFCVKHQHYYNDTGATKDGRTIRPADPALWEALWHDVAQVTASDPYVEGFPAQKSFDRQLAEDSTIVMRHLVTDPRKRYRTARRQMVMGALAARAWCMWVEYDRRAGGIVFRVGDPTRTFVAPPFTDPHHPLCPYVGEEIPMRLCDILKMRDTAGWKNVERVVSDGTAISRARSQGPDASTSDRDSPAIVSEMGRYDLTATVLRWWFRYDDSKITRKAKRPLDIERQKMVCPRCRFETTEHPRGAAGILPEIGLPCPQCNEERMVRVDSEEYDQEDFAFPKGRLVVVAPHCRTTLYDGPWPYRGGIRSFPLMYMRATEDPRDLIPQCKTSIYGSLAVILDQLHRQGYEQMRLSKPIIIVAGDGDSLQDFRGEPFAYTDEAGQMAYAVGNQPIGQLIHQFQGNGIPPGFPPLIQNFQNRFRPNQADLGITQQSSKDIAVGTVQALLETGEITVDDIKRRLNDEESIGLGVALDIYVSETPLETGAQLFDNGGVDRFLALKESDTASGVNVTVTAAPTLKRTAQDDFQAIMTLMGMPPPQRMVAARLLNIPESVLRELEQAEAQQAQVPPGAVPPVAVPPGAPPNPATNGAPAMTPAA